MIKTFNIGIKALVLNKNKALILKEIDIRRNNIELYDLPGGRMEEGEEAEETLKRELKEELGVSKYSIGPIIHAQIHPYYDKEGSALMLIFYKINLRNPKIKLSKEHVGFEWMSKKDLKKIIKNKGKMHIGIRTALAKVLK